MKEGSLKNIVLVDDHIILRNGLHELIEKLGPYKICSEYDHGLAFLEALPITPMPDLIIMDLTMPEMNGDEVLAAMNGQGIELPVLILTLNHDEKRIVSLFRAGIRGYLEKNCTAAIMKEALAEIFESGYYKNDLMTMALKADDRPQKTPRDLVLEKLSVREKEFLKLVCDPAEYTYRQIAKMMNVVPRTIDGYRESVFSKFDVKSKTGLVLFAVKHQLIEEITSDTPS